MLAATICFCRKLQRLGDDNSYSAEVTRVWASLVVPRKRVSIPCPWEVAFSILTFTIQTWLRKTESEGSPTLWRQLSYENISSLTFPSKENNIYMVSFVFWGGGWVMVKDYFVAELKSKKVNKAWDIVPSFRLTSEKPHCGSQKDITNWVILITFFLNYRHI